MKKITMKIYTKYDRGDVVIFEKDGILICGIIEGYYIDYDAGISIWYNIRTSKNNVFTYSNGGDIAEWNIIGKINSETALFKSCREKILDVKVESKDKCSNCAKSWTDDCPRDKCWNNDYSEFIEESNGVRNEDNN